MHEEGKARPWQLEGTRNGGFTRKRGKTQKELKKKELFVGFTAA